MRAWVSHGAGLERLKLETRETPRPGPGQVLLRLRAASVALRDHKMALGAYGAGADASGRVLGGEGVGEVAALGPGVSGWVIGQRVSPLFIQGYTAERIAAQAIAATSLGGLQRDGCFAEFMLADAAALVEVPNHLSDAQAAALPFAGLTAWCALRSQRALRPGDWVVTQGSNGLMLLALQFALAAGARVIVTSKNDDKLARAQALGATRLINYQSRPDWAAAVHDITQGEGAALVLDPGGAQTIAQSLAALQPGGTCCVVGALGASPELGISLPLLLGHQLSVVGCNGGSLAAHRAMAAEVARACIEPVVEAVWPFEQLPEALAGAPKAEQFGKVALQIAE
ncbi:zinc-dependent alcohol dehydrogenase family protein [Aquabacterium sp.]|uniref:zinc-dependent alcohol dehydrogenase family protein n=1 Tax=Aquabacterium sp. TaxID=1872578 RepID=UPI002C4BEB6E|nr:NAD(P)-dependent alcohol dehydrogenase [Aquabacterium sp.]HSW06032.1 NAD(P)-dependent alcohol dehydrogenase [Aquabacterium sp.]